MGTTVALASTPVEIDVDAATDILVQNQSATALVAMAVTDTETGTPSRDATDVILRPLEWHQWSIAGGNTLYGWVVGRDLSNAVILDGQGDDGTGAIRWMEAPTEVSP